MIWPNLEDPEAGVRFVLDDPTEAYLWKGLEETGCAAMKTISEVAEIVGRDLSSFAKVWSTSLLG